MSETRGTRENRLEEETIGAIVAADIRTAEVFARHGIDFCCGGQTSLAAACRERGLDPVVVLGEIEAARREPLERSRNFGAWELPFLADYIVNTHHAYLNEELAPIAAYARKIAAVHGDRHPETVEIAAVFDRIAAAMGDHLREEEEILFPALKRIDAALKAGAPPAAGDRAVIRTALETLHREHEEIGDAVHAIRRLAHGYEVPADGCNTYAVTYRKLEEFEDDLHQHVHLENNILFAKAARL